MELSDLANVTSDMVVIASSERIVHSYHVTFDGVLRVVDPDLMLLALKNGIGSQKAFGCGMLSIARPKR
jgi:CRISPR-associated protein Cas6/Cse3/CasE subtype I-E